MLIHILFNGVIYEKQLGYTETSTESRGDVEEFLRELAEKKVFLYHERTPEGDTAIENQTIQK